MTYPKRLIEVDLLIKKSPNTPIRGQRMIEIGLPNKKETRSALRLTQIVNLYFVRS